MAQTAPIVLTRDEYHLKIRRNVDALKARLNLAPYFVPDKEQDKVRRYFMERAVQVGEACFRISDLQMPLFALARVLCEDFFTLYWVSLSDKNASDYCKRTVSEMAKMLEKHIANKRIRVREISTGKDVTVDALKKITPHVTKKKRIEQIATESGLGKVYDIVYRYDCLEVHGNTFGLSEAECAMDGIAVAASAVNALLRVILLVVDNQDRIVTADEVLSTLNMRHVPGT
jgi:hypothetical protein